MSRPGRARGSGSFVADESGAAMALVVLFLPCLLAAAALVLDVGALLLARAEMRAAADMGALAGVQDLDFDRLARGEIVIREAEAAADAESWVRANLAGKSFVEPGTVVTAVAVRNTWLRGGVACPVTGRALADPTVCVRIRARVKLPFLASLGTVTVSVHADASVVGRP